MAKIQLPNVTLTAVSSIRLPQTIKALKYSMRGIEFGEVALLCDEKPAFLPKDIDFRKIDKISNIDEFNRFMVYDVHKYINTDYMMLIHYDGFIVNPDKWSDEFLKYDYIGAPWPVPPAEDKITFRDEDGTLYRVGNSVSIRSKKLMELPSAINLKWESFHGWYNEDGFICVNRRKVFEEHGCKYAPVDVAARFSRESDIPETEGIEPFCFHKWSGNNSKYPHFTPFSWLWF